MKKRSFCVLILTHGRADNVRTLKTLERSGYKGDWFLVVDDQDKQADLYKEKYGDRVIIFSKEEIAAVSDSRTNSGERRAILFARNASFQIAKDLGYDTFVQLDDDYTSFGERITADSQYSSKGQNTCLLDECFDAMCDLLYAPGFLSVAFAQGGDLIGGKESTVFKRYSRKCMNSFFCRTDRPFLFQGVINEDVNTYVGLGKIGGLFLTVPHIVLTQVQTQAASGGITDFYLDFGTYQKSMATVIGDPASVKIGVMGVHSPRIHHRVSWNNAVVKIVPESVRKV